MLKTLFAAAVVALSALAVCGQPTGDLDQQRKRLEAELKKLEERDAGLRAKADSLGKDFARLDGQARQVTAAGAALKAREVELDREADGLKSREQKLAARRPKQDAAAKRLAQDAARLTAGQQELEAEAGAIESVRRRLDGTNRSAVARFNAQVDAHQARARDLQHRVRECNAAAHWHQEDLKAFNAQADELNALRQVLRANLQQWNTENAKNHSDAAVVRQAAQALDQRRTDLNVAAATLRVDQKTLSDRLAAFNARTGKPGGGQPVLLDDNVANAGASEDLTRDAREQARKAEEERKRLEKR